MRFDTFLAIQKTPITLVTRDHMFVCVCMFLCVCVCVCVCVHVCVCRGAIHSDSYPTRNRTKQKTAVSFSSLARTHAHSMSGRGGFIMLLSRINWKSLRWLFLKRFLSVSEKTVVSSLICKQMPIRSHYSLIILDGRYKFKSGISASLKHISLRTVLAIM